MEKAAVIADQERRKELIIEALHDALGVINLVNIRYLLSEALTLEELLAQIGATDMDDFSFRMTKADVALKSLIRDISGEPYRPRALESYMVPGDDAAA